MKFNMKKKEPLTREALIELGWKEINSEKDKTRRYYEKDNYFVIFREPAWGPNTIQIVAKDPSKINWIPDPENFRIYIKCPSIEAFQIIENLL